MKEEEFKPPPSPPPHLIVTEITQQLLPIPSYSSAKKRCVSAYKFRVRGGGAIQGGGGEFLSFAALLTTRSTIVLFTKHEISSLTYYPEYYGSIHKT